MAQIIEYLIANGVAGKRKSFLRTVNSQAEIEKYRKNRFKLHRKNPAEYDIQFVIRYSPAEVKQNKHRIFKA